MLTLKIQELIHKLEVGIGVRVLQYAMLAVLVLAVLFVYDLRAYRGFSSPEAMDVGQVARNLEEGRGFSTDYIRPFSLYLMQKHSLATHPEQALSTNQMDAARIYGAHPDLANAPVYPLVLAGLMKVWTPDWTVEMHKPFWSEGGRFIRYQPEFRIALFNQFLLVVVVGLTFFLAKKLFDRRAAWLAALFTLGSAQLWQFSVSGLSTLLLLVILLGLVLCLVKAEELGRAQAPKAGGLLAFAVAAGVLAGLGMLTRYSFGALIVPVAVFFWLFTGSRQPKLVLAAIFSFGLVVSPWIARNVMVSGTLFGTAGYAINETSYQHPGSELMRSIDPSLVINSGGVMPYVYKFTSNLSSILQEGWERLGGIWLAVLFFAGLLLGLRNVAARRLRYFTLMSLGTLVIVEALGKTGLSDLSPDLNSENLLVLLRPLVAVFGTVFFLTLLDQMKFPEPAMRYGVIALLVVLACQPLASAMISRTNPVSYPPYYPPEIQQVAGWMKTDELLMSDAPWAVAWYGQRQCVWLTRDTREDFYTINDYLKPVKGLYFTTLSMDDKFLSNMAHGADNSWGRFLLNAGMQSKFPKGFPLQTPKILGTGLFVSDRPR